MMGMAKGLDYVEGTFTVPSDASVFTLQYGKTYNSYVLLIEMTDETKATFINSGTSNAGAVLFLGRYPELAVGNSSYDAIVRVFAFVPSSNSFQNSSVLITALTGSSIELSTRDIDGTGTVRLIRGLSYKYTVISLDDV